MVKCSPLDAPLTRDFQPWNAATLQFGTQFPNAHLQIARGLLDRENWRKRGIFHTFLLPTLLLRQGSMAATCEQRIEPSGRATFKQTTNRDALISLHLVP